MLPARSFPAALLMTVVVLLTPPLDAREIVLELRNGRLLSGEVDERTDDQELWLHSAEPSIVLLTSIPWTDVITARAGKDVWSAEMLRASAAELKAPLPTAVLRQSLVMPELPPPRQPPPRVQSIEMRVALANWDRDAEPDGIEVRLTPQTLDGTALPVEGTVSVRLLGRRIVSNSRLESSSDLGFWTGRSAVLENHTDGNTQPYLEVGRWNVRVRKTDLSNQGDYVLQLPFRNIHPEYDLDIGLYGQVDAKLNVTGQSVYYATTPITLRGFSPLREELQLNRRTRFFPDEMRSR